MVTEKRLIDAWDLIEWLDDFDRENTLRVLKGQKAKLLNSHAIKNMIVTVPRADAVEIVHGRWIHDINNMYGCSECGERETMSPKKPKNYCPNCGSRMDGGK